MSNLAAASRIIHESEIGWPAMPSGSPPCS